MTTQIEKKKELKPPTDFWGVLAAAKREVESWEVWERRYEADIYYEGYLERQTTVVVVKLSNRGD